MSFPSLHSLLMWLHSMFDLSWSSLFFVYSLFHYHSYHCFWFIPFASPPYSFLTLTYSKFDISLASFLHISLLVRFVSFVFSFILYSRWALSGPWLTSFSIHFIFYTWGHGFFIIGYFGPSFSSFILSYHPSLHYIPCLKTTLRPWDQMSSSTTPT